MEKYSGKRVKFNELHVSLKEIGQDKVHLALTQISGDWGDEGSELIIIGWEVPSVNVEFIKFSEMNPHVSTKTTVALLSRS